MQIHFKTIAIAILSDHDSPALIQGLRRHTKVAATAQPARLDTRLRRRRPEILGTFPRRIRAVRPRLRRRLRHHPLPHQRSLQRDTDPIAYSRPHRRITSIKSAWPRRNSQPGPHFHSLSKGKLSSRAKPGICFFFPRSGKLYFSFVGYFGGIVAYPGAACLIFFVRSAFTSPIAHRNPPPSKFTKNGISQFSARSPIAV